MSEKLQNTIGILCIQSHYYAMCLQASYTPNEICSVVINHSLDIKERIFKKQYE